MGSRVDGDRPGSQDQKGELQNFHVVPILESPFDKNQGYLIREKSVQKYTFSVDFVLKIIFLDFTCKIYYTPIVPYLKSQDFENIIVGL